MEPMLLRNAIPPDPPPQGGGMEVRSPFPACREGLGVGALPATNCDPVCLPRDVSRAKTALRPHLHLRDGA